MSSGLRALAVALALALLCGAPSRAAAAPKRRSDRPRSRGSGWWLAKHRALRAIAKQVRAGKRPQPELIFVGDSITSGWDNTGSGVFKRFYAKRHAINLGVEGDRTEHVLWRLRHGEVAGLRPKVAVVLIGTNNAMNDYSAAIARGIVAVVRELERRLPRTRILLLAIFPRDRKPTPRRARVASASKLAARALRGDKRVTYRDIGRAFLAKDGRIPFRVMSDYLHLTGAGYRRWAEAIEPTLRKLLARGLLRARASRQRPRAHGAKEHR